MKFKNIPKIFLLFPVLTIFFFLILFLTRTKGVEIYVFNLPESKTEYYILMKVEKVLSQDTEKINIIHKDGSIDSVSNIEKFSIENSEDYFLGFRVLSEFEYEIKDLKFAINNETSYLNTKVIDSAEVKLGKDSIYKFKDNSLYFYSENENRPKLIIGSAQLNLDISFGKECMQEDLSHMKYNFNFIRLENLEECKAIFNNLFAIKLEDLNYKDASKYSRYDNLQFDLSFDTDLLGNVILNEKNELKLTGTLENKSDIPIPVGIYFSTSTDNIDQFDSGTFFEKIIKPNSMEYVLEFSGGERGNLEIYASNGLAVDANISLMGSGIFDDDAMRITSYNDIKFLNFDKSTSYTKNLETYSDLEMKTVESDSLDYTFFSESSLKYGVTELGCVIGTYNNQFSFYFFPSNNISTCGEINQIKYGYGCNLEDDILPLSVSIPITNSLGNYINTKKYPEGTINFNLEVCNNDYENKSYLQDNPVLFEDIYTINSKNYSLFLDLKSYNNAYNSVYGEISGYLLSFLGSIKEK